MVGHPPYASPTKMRPSKMNTYLPVAPPSARHAPAASMKRVFTSVAAFLPNLSKLLPAMIRPPPLKSDTIMPSTAVPPKATEIFAALFITRSPAEFRRMVQRTKTQKRAVFIISPAE